MAKKKIPKGEQILVYLIIFMTISVFGAYMNISTLMVNDCKMPVKSLSVYETKTHFTYQEPEQVNKQYLTDFIKFRFISPNHIFSPGDLVIFLGLGGMAFNLIRYNIFQIKQGRPLW